MKKRNAATIAIATYGAVAVPGVLVGEDAVADVQTISAKTISQLQLTPKRMPAIRPSRRLEPTTDRVRGQLAIR